MYILEPVLSNFYFSGVLLASILLLKCENANTLAIASAEHAADRGLRSLQMWAV